MSIPSYEELLERNKRMLEADKKKAINDSDTLFDTQEKDVTATYQNAMDEAKKSYADEYERNAVSRIINEKKIAEKNARLGLGDSGLNATERAATELAYANQRGKIDLARRQTEDAYAQKLAEAVSQIKLNKASARANIENNYVTLAANNAQQEYKTNVDAQNELYKAALSATKSSSRSSSRGSGNTGSNEKSGLITVSGGLVSRDFTGTLQDNGVDVIQSANGKVTYIDRNTGKKSTFDAGINPYTGTRNRDVDNGTFSNGYQPNNVNGQPLKKYDTLTDGGKSGQTVWKANGKYYVWYGEYNDYVEVKKVGNEWKAV